MWSFRLAVFGGCQDDLEGVLRAQRDVFGERDMVGKPESIRMLISIMYIQAIVRCGVPIRPGITTYLSLKPAAPFALTEITASSKFHDEAALTALAPSSRADGSNERRNFMVGVVLFDSGIPSVELGAAYFRELNTFLRVVAAAPTVRELAPLLN